ncbi:MAG: tripartite tricarboxylate transporter substrate binding protein [Betaproteobacteria bacterium]|nr:tripartite tricarboxylate transporter substrate binding protein [Betaproteobacteria bacterium]
MKLHGRSILVVLGLLAGSLPAVCSAAQPQASDFPNKPIRWIIPFPPGGSNDVLGRYLGIKLTERVGQQIVIDNRAGANGIIGTELAANAPADGYTLLMVSTSFVMNAAVRRLPYDIEKSFDPISMIGSAPNSIVTHPQRGFGTLRELVDRARAKPASIFYAATGIGGFNHFGGELFKKVAGIDMIMVPYKGGGPAMIDVMAGNMPIMFSSLTQVLPHVRSGRLKVLAIGAAKRSPVVPDVPTVIESGFPGYEVTVWWGIAAPHGAPRAALEKLRREFTAILQEPETKKRLLADAAEPEILTPAELRKVIHNDRKRWAEVAKQAGIHVQ